MEATSQGYPVLRAAAHLPFERLPVETERRLTYSLQLLTLGAVVIRVEHEPLLVVLLQQDVPRVRLRVGPHGG